MPIRAEGELFSKDGQEALPPQHRGFRAEGGQVEVPKTSETPFASGGAHLEFHPLSCLETHRNGALQAAPGRQQSSAPGGGLTHGNTTTERYT